MCPMNKIMQQNHALYIILQHREIIKKANYYYNMSKHYTTLGDSRVACDPNVIPKDARMVGTWC